MKLYEIKKWVQSCGFAVETIKLMGKDYSEAEAVDTAKEVNDLVAIMIRLTPLYSLEMNDNLFDSTKCVLSSIETLILRSDKDDREALVRGIASESEIYDYIDEGMAFVKSEIPLCSEYEHTFRDVCEEAEYFAYMFASMCRRYNIAATIFVGGTEKPIDKFAVERYGPTEPRSKYKTIPRTHRIAVLGALIGKLGLCKHTDKTRIAEFVEAVTGGNTQIKGKDTVSYKRPTADASAAADEWLKKIGIE